MPSLIQSQDSQDSADYEDPTTIKLAKINQFDKQVKTLEEQDIDKEIDVPVMLQRMFQQAKPFTKSIGDASGTIYRQR